MQILDSGAAIARQVKKVLEEKSALSGEMTPQRTFFTTGEPEHINRIAKKLLNATITTTAVSL